MVPVIRKNDDRIAAMNRNQAGPLRSLQADKAARIDLVESLFRTVHEFPIPDFSFPDINPLLTNIDVFRDIIESFAHWHAFSPPDRIVCIESFGYLFGAPLAHRLGAGIALARRKGKLPRAILAQDYSMIYSPHKTLEIQQDSCEPGKRVAVVDDFLATGGTAEAVLKLLQRLDVEVAGLNFVVEVVGAGGRGKICRYCDNIQSLIKMRYNAHDKRWQVLDLDPSFYLRHVTTED
jgi:adenine phosphoribosyltransferase